MSKDDTQDELLRLCEEVYKRFPEWKTGRHIWSMKTPVICKGDDFMDGMSFPLYTSDYLLEKLPGYITRKQDDEVGDLRMIKTGGASGSYTYYYEFGVPEYRSYGNTPLKALLKLVIALDRAGGLNE